MAKAKPVKRKPKKRLVRNKDWHVWAWEYSKGECTAEEPDVYDLCVWDTKPGHRMSRKGRWVRVKFVVVEG